MHKRGSNDPRNYHGAGTSSGQGNLPPWNFSTDLPAQQAQPPSGVGQRWSHSSTGSTQHKNPNYAKRDPFDQGSSAQDQFNQPKPLARRPPTVICYICGREYGTASIGIHEKQCIVKWRRENDELPRDMRRPEPIKPQISMQTGASTSGEKREISGTKGGEYNLDAINDAALASHQGQYVKCDKCGRTFLPDRLAVHAKSCRGFSRRR